MSQPLPSRRSIHRRPPSSATSRLSPVETTSGITGRLSPVETTNSTTGRLSSVETTSGIPGRLSSVETTNSTTGRLSPVETTNATTGRLSSVETTSGIPGGFDGRDDDAVAAQPPRETQPTPETAEPTPTAPTLAELQDRARAQHAPPPDADAIVECHGLVRIFQSEGVEVVALQGLDLIVRRGELIAIVGASGSGKSTLLNILSGLDAPTAGAVTVAGQNLVTMTPAQRLAYRRNTVGFVFQQTAANLLPYLTAAENVEVPLRATGMKPKARAARAAELLNVLGIGEYADRLPSQLSGGQQQRVAIAVALANNPELILADEPTGELDSATAADVYDAFAQVNAQLGVTVIIVTHDQTVASQVDRTVAIRDGRTSSETLRTVVEDDAVEGEPAERITQEYAVLDRAGRLQLPHDLVAALGLHSRVRLELADDHIRIYPADSPAGRMTPDSVGRVAPQVHIENTESAAQGRGEPSEPPSRDPATSLRSAQDDGRPAVALLPVECDAAEGSGVYRDHGSAEGPRPLVGEGQQILRLRALGGEPNLSASVGLASDSVGRVAPQVHIETTESPSPRPGSPQ